MHLARLATQGANSIKLTYSSLGPIVSDFDEIKGNFGQLRSVLFICELKRAAVCAENRQIKKRCQNKMTAVFPIVQPDAAFRIIHKSGLRSKFRAL